MGSCDDSSGISVYMLFFVFVFWCWDYDSETSLMSDDYEIVAF